MAKLWILNGNLEAPGWQTLRSDHEAEKVDIVHLDPRVWALISADEPPAGYEGLTPGEPVDGVYVDPNGSPLYLVNGAVVADATSVVQALGEQATSLLETLGDADRVLERLGRAF